MARVFVAMAGSMGALAVGLGAFGAHGLQSRLAEVADGAKRLGWWETAAHYHLVHALAMALAAWLVVRGGGGAASAAGWAFIVGVVIFSGSLYTMALGGPRWLGAVTPIGGLALIAGWVLVAVAGWRAFE